MLLVTSRCAFSGSKKNFSLENSHLMLFFLNLLFTFKEHAVYVGIFTVYNTVYKSSQ